MLLTKDVIRDELKQNQTVFKFYSSEKISLPKPRLKSAISESLVAHLIQDKMILNALQISEVKFSASGGDLEIALNEGNRKVEVKSSAKSAFQYFGNKDLDADYLIWVHFGEMLEKSDLGEIEVLIIEQKELKEKIEELPQSKKVSLKKIKTVFNGRSEIKIININQI